MAAILDHITLRSGFRSYSNFTFSDKETEARERFDQGRTSSRTLPSTYSRIMALSQAGAFPGALSWPFWGQTLSLPCSPGSGPQCFPCPWGGDRAGAPCPAAMGTRKIPSGEGSSSKSGQQPRQLGFPEGQHRAGLAWSLVPPTRGQPRVRNTAYGRGLCSGILGPFHERVCAQDSLVKGHGQFHGLVNIPAVMGPDLRPPGMSRRS